MSNFSIPPETKRRQQHASDPLSSVWVSANAGSGKTFVLARRVVRLLLTGVEPNRILCLTYTKAAASEMSQRIFSILADWASMDDATLIKALTDLQDTPPTEANTRLARTLFAVAMEAPGGLKIQTIHAFCERLLHQFPLEAQVPGYFRVLEGNDAGQLFAASRDEVLARAAVGHNDPISDSYQRLIAERGDLAIRDALGELQNNSARVKSMLTQHGGMDGAVRALYGYHDIDQNLASIDENFYLAFPDHFSRGYAQSLLSFLAAGKDRDQQLGKRIRDALDSDTDIFLSYCSIFLTMDKGGVPRSLPHMLTKAVKEQVPDLEQRCADEIERLAPLYQAYKRRKAVELSSDILRLGADVTEEYEAAKARQGVLDFGDLIERTGALLARSEAASWVQYKLDEGLDHILIDEAQDTSPDQWSVVTSLTQDFFAGQSAKERPRSIFAVGDEKQSIYSFQGAAPELFDQKRHQFHDTSTGAGQSFQQVHLNHSFRSVGRILSAVDTVFQEGSAASGLSFSDQPMAQHKAVRDETVGRVDVWDAIISEQPAEPEDWTTPIDHMSEGSAENQLAYAIAAQIRLWLDRNALLCDGTSMRPGDILVLVRKRGKIVEPLSRAMKMIGIPVAGSDRILLSSHPVVEDLLAIARFTLMPEDDLNLASLLKSPFIGWNDDDLMAIAPSRKGTLFAAIGSAASPSNRNISTYQKLRNWLGRADRQLPFQFFAQCLGSEGGRRAVATRFGAEADDVLDEFLSRCLDYEETAAPPSLQGFVAFLSRDENEIKREIDRQRDEVRIMTVHGAKGLEAPVVILVDTGAGAVHSSHQSKMLTLGTDRNQPDGLMLNLGKSSNSSSQTAALDQWQMSAQDEYHRLLYVAMTRAKDRLVITGALNKNKKNKGKMPDDGWYQLIRSRLENDGSTLVDGPPSVTGFTWQSRSFETESNAETVKSAESKAKPATQALPDPIQPNWLFEPAPLTTPLPLSIQPSKAILSDPSEVYFADADSQREFITPDPAQSSISSANGLARGKLLHQLLQYLPDIAQDKRRDAGLLFVQKFAPEYEGEGDKLVGEVLQVLEDPQLKPLFSRHAIKEAPIAGFLDRSDGRQIAVSGKMDLLSKTESALLIVDFKTDRSPPTSNGIIPRSYLIQMALYRALLARIDSQLPVQAGLLWTAIPRLDWLQDEELEKILSMLLKQTDLGT